MVWIEMTSHLPLDWQQLLYPFFPPHPTPTAEMHISQLLKMADISRDLLPLILKGF